MKPVQLLQLALLGLLWGSSYLFIKVAVKGIDPATLVEGRLVIGTAVLFCLLRLRRRRLPRDPRLWFHLLVMAVVGVVLPQLLIAWSEQHIASSLAAILNATTPFFTLCFAAGLFQTERFSAEKLGGLLIGFAGIAVLAGAGLADLAASSTRGELAMLLSSVGYGAGFAYARRYLRGDAAVLAGGEMLLAALVAVPVVLATGHPGAMDLTLVRLVAWLALGAFSSGFAYILYFGLIESAGATRASFGTYLIPPVGVFWGWLLLGEGVGTRTIAGVVLILGGVALATWTRGNRAAPALAPTSAVQGEEAVESARFD